MRTSVLRMQFCEFKFFVTSCLIEPRQKKIVEGKVRMLNNSRRSNSVRTVSQGTIPVLASSNGSATSTRKDYSSVREPSTVFEEENPNGDSTDTPIVGIIMESDSDLPVMNDAARTLSDFGVPYEIKILSPHQNRKEALSYALSAKERGIKIIIVGDGVEAHLSGTL
ncbi:phosphoribosylaminoimidazole carboxylase [Citrus clementina]|uniref:phosphoribosylaminoimidazole carboxylase n=1 Tax=Citrus clementina TaxID=85681 RepID=UPI000CED7DAA|nr:phosphoribosylaminoimidazole carboxylase [Citrus x clementina]